MIRQSTVLLVAFVVLSFFADSGAARTGVMTGTVTEWKAGQLIAVANDQADPGGFRIAVRDTVFEGDPAAIRPGVRVTVHYRFVGERRTVAARIRVLVNSAITSGQP